MQVNGFKKMGFGRNVRSFKDMNEVRQKRSVQARKLREARAERRKEIAQQAISRMSQNANIFSIQTDASYTSIEQTLIVAQQRAIDAAAAKSASGVGQNADISA